MVDDDDGDEFPSPEPRTDSRTALPREIRAWRRLRIVKRDESFSLIRAWRALRIVEREYMELELRSVQVQGAHEAGGAPSTLVDASCPFRTTSYFPIFLNIPKRRKIAIRTVLESVYLPYHVPIPFRSLKCSGRCPLCIPPGLRFQ